VVDIWQVGVLVLQGGVGVRMGVRAVAGLLIRVVMIVMVVIMAVGMVVDHSLVGMTVLVLFVDQ